MLSPPSLPIASLLPSYASKEIANSSLMIPAIKPKSAPPSKNKGPDVTAGISVGRAEFVNELLCVLHVGAAYWPPH
ncbi:hypothetical protein E2C01_068938 [Portunus trituberculatus]|uniref:Uncharacterized protein n=1 Tax=Portunus trituberculatus TaxID=210409 RepID=A0A5B7HXK3_PORTR|nr:hypothetical protein [Portunus trituberculatus]